MSKPGRPPLAVCYGTRPQVIKASILIEELSSRWDLITVDTGQHYDHKLNAVFYEQLGVREASFFLEVGSADHAVQTSSILTRSAEVFAARQPAAVVVIGDTNSTLGCALAAAKMRVPVVHVEAGLRSGDLMMAEEINRRVVDAISVVLCAPSSAAEQNLRTEHAPGRVVRTGDIARDVLLRSVKRIESDGQDLVPPQRETPFAFVTLHRAELTDQPVKLAGVLEALSALELPVVFALHPRTRAALERHGLLDALGPNLQVCPPQGYFETLAYLRSAAIVITDSGGLQREAYWLGTPCVTVRHETEWVETVQLGANVLLAPDRAPTELQTVVRQRLDQHHKGKVWDRDAYGAGDAACRVSEAIEQWAVAGLGH